MRNIIIGMVVGAVIAAALCCLILRPSEPREGEKSIIYQTDTITIVKPLYITQYITRVDTCYLHSVDTLYQKDTVRVEIPITTREYRDSTYYARVSGYEPSLDYIETYNLTTNVLTNSVKNAISHKWGIGIQAGYGAWKNGLTPYIGIGVQYSLATW